MNSLQTNGYNLIRLLRAIGENVEFEICGELTYFINFENNLIKINLDMVRKKSMTIL